MTGIRLAAVLTATLLAISGCGSDGSAGRDTGVDVLPSEWVALPAAPIEPRAGALGVWTGSEVVIVGGEPRAWCPPNADCIAPDFPPLADGAAFDPVSRSWRVIAAAPQPLVGRAPTAVHSGDVYVLAPDLSWRGGGDGAFLRYRPADDAWTELPAPPPSSWDRHLIVAGDAVVAYQTSDEQGEQPDFAFDTAAEEWSKLPDDPLGPSFDRLMVGVDGEVVLFAKELVPNPGSSSPSLARIATFAPDTRAWDSQGEAEILGTWSGAALGAEIVFPHAGSADGGEVNNWGRSYPMGGVYDTESGSWTELPEPASEDGFRIAGVQASDALIVGSVDGSMLDLEQGSWADLPAVPDVDLEIFGRTVVAAGRSVLVYGGESWTGSSGIVIGDAYLLPPELPR